MSSGKTDLPPWMSFVYDCLEWHLKTYESPQLEILPHPTPDRGKCGNHEAIKTHLHHFCLFLCCAKEISRYCLEAVATLRGARVEEEEEEDKEYLAGSQDFCLDYRSSAENGGTTTDVNCVIGERESFGVIRQKLTLNGANDNGRVTGDPSIPRLRNFSSRVSEVPPKAQKSPSSYSVRLARLSLLVQPEDYRSWNILKHPRLSSTSELKYAYFVLTKHPRSSETFCHLRYLSSRISREAADNFATKLALCRQGFAKCGDAASRYHGNYHAWDHRRFLVSLLIESRDEDGDENNEKNDETHRNDIDERNDDVTTHRNGVCEKDDDVIDDVNRDVNDDVVSILQRELDDVKTFQSTRVSDACPFKYRLFLVETRSIAGLTGPTFDFLGEMEELNRLMSVYPGHESLWNYRGDLINLAQKEDEANCDLLGREDAAFLSSVETKCRNDWEITLLDRYRSRVSASVGGCR